MKTAKVPQMIHIAPMRKSCGSRLLVVLGFSELLIYLLRHRRQFVEEIERYAGRDDEKRQKPPSKDITPRKKKA